MLRTFIAARIPETPQLRKLLERLSRLGEKFAPVSPKNLHVTLKFLGDTEERPVTPVAECVRRIASSHPPDELGLNGVGLFLMLAVHQSSGLVSKTPIRFPQWQASWTRNWANWGLCPKRAPFTP